MAGYRLFNIGKKKWFDVKIPEMKEFIGRFVKVKDENHKEHVVEIEKIMGNLADPRKFEIISKGQHFLISMLDFFSQMNGENLTKEEIELWESMIFHVAPTRKTMLDLQRKKMLLGGAKKLIH